MQETIFHLSSKLWRLRSFDEALCSDCGRLYFTTIFRCVSSQWENDTLVFSIRQDDPFRSPFHWKWQKDAVDLERQSHAINV